MSEDLFDVTPILGGVVALIVWAFRWWQVRCRDAKAKRPVSFEIGILGEARDIKQAPGQSGKGR